jgi:hypothetical protein
MARGRVAVDSRAWAWLQGEVGDLLLLVMVVVVVVVVAGRCCMT